MRGRRCLRVLRAVGVRRWGGDAVALKDKLARLLLSRAAMGAAWAISLAANVAAGGINVMQGNAAGTVAALVAAACAALMLLSLWLKGKADDENEDAGEG